MQANIITLDVREEVRAGREPFPRIMEAIGRLRDGDSLRVIAPFEPRPLIGLLTAQGFDAEVTALTDGDFEVVFTAPTPRDDEPLL